jgi:cell division protein FtsB
MKNILRTLVVTLFVAMAGVIALGYVNFVNTQEVVKSQKAQIEKLTQQNNKDSVELQDTKEELQDLKKYNVYNEDGTFNAKVYSKDGKEYTIMSEKGILGNVKTVVVEW